MLSPSTDPLGMNPIEIRDVECIEDALVCRSEGQLFLIGLFGEAGVQSRDHINTPRTKSHDKIAVHRVFVDVDPDPTHASGSPTVLLFEGLGCLRLSLKVRVDLWLVGVVVRKGRMNLSQR